MAKKKRIRRPRGSVSARRMGRTGSLQTASISAIRAEIERRKDQLNARRNELQAEIQAVDAQLAEFGESRSAGAARPGSAPVVRRGRPRKEGGGEGQPLQVMLRQALLAKPLSIGEAIDAVKKAGYKTASPNFRTIVNSTLLKFPQTFKRVGRGMYVSK